MAGLATIAAGGDGGPELASFTAVRAGVGMFGLAIVAAGGDGGPEFVSFNAADGRVFRSRPEWKSLESSAANGTTDPALPAAEASGLA